MPPIPTTEGSESRAAVEWGYLMKNYVFGALVPLVMLSACGGVDPDESIAAIRHTEQSQLQSIEADDLVGIARLYRDDARLVRPDGSVLDGGVAIVEAYDALLADPNFALTIEPVAGWASAGGDMAVVTSTVAFTTSDPETGEAVTLPLNSQTVWQRETGATWQIVSAYNVAIAPGEAAEGTTAETGD